MTEVGHYYALCVENAEGNNEIAFLDLGKSGGLGRFLAIAVYSFADGPVQQDHLETYAERYVVSSQPPYEEMLGERLILPVSNEDLLDAMNRGLPNSVFIDGRKVAGSVFKAQVKGELGISLKQPRLIRPDDPAL